MRSLVLALGCGIVSLGTLFAQPTIQQSSLPDGVQNSPYSAQLTATGGFGNYIFSIVPGTGTGTPPGVNIQSNGAFTGTPTATGLYTFTVKVTDTQTMLSSTKAFSINVTAPQPLSIATLFLPDATVTVPYSVQLQATGGSGNSANYQWGMDAVLPGISLSPQGVLAGTPTAAGTFKLPVTVFDQKTQQGAFRNLSLTIDACAPTFVTTSPLPTWDVNIHYSQVFQATGCSGQYTFTASPASPFSSNSLPHGLNLAPSGALTGFPDTVGTSNFVVTVTDNVTNGGQTAGAFSLTINPLPNVTTPSQLPSGQAGRNYSQQFQATGGTGSLTFSADNPDNIPGFAMSSSGLLTIAAPTVGLYTFFVKATDSINISSQAMAFGLTINAIAPSVQAFPSSVTFNADAGGNAPPPQAISLGPAPNATTATYRVLIDGGPNAPAPFSLTANPSSGSVPAQLVISADQGNLPPGSSTARLRIIDGNSLETDVAATLIVSANPNPAQLQVVPGALHFTESAQRPGVFEQDIAISSTGGTGTLGFSIATLNGSPWASVTPSSGQTVRNAFVFARVSINTQGMQRSDSDVLRLTYSGGHIDVPISVFLANDGPIIGSNVTGVLLQAQQGGGFSNAQTIKILNQGSANTTVNWTATLLSGEDILAFSGTTGTATPSNPGSLTFTLKPSATQLPPGSHYALISVSDPKSQNSPVLIVVVLNLAAAGSPAVPDLSPAGLYYLVVAGGAKSAPQVVTVNTSSPSAVPFQVAALTDDGGSWLIASASSGLSSGQTPGNFSLVVDPSRLTAGLHTAQANVSMSNQVRTENVTVVVLPAGSTIPSSAAGPGDMARDAAILAPRAAGCSPGKLALTETGLVNNFAVPAGWPATLIVQLNDDCGNAVANGSVVASFSNGDAPLSLRGDGQAGNYSATWQPGTATSAMAVTLNATAGTLQPATMQLIGGVAQNQAAAPVLTAGGTMNNFYPVPGGPLSPGTVASVSGSGLASTQVSLGLPPLPPSINGTTVLVGGLPAPLYYLSNGLLAVQIPSELTANQRYSIIVSANGAISLPDQLDILPLQPAVLAFADGQCGVPFKAQDCFIHLVAQHSDANATLVDSTHPAKPGEVLIAYLVGMGPTNPGVASGAPAPAVEPLARVTTQPSVTVDGAHADIQYAGLTPALAGLYQIKFVVPPTARSGDLTVVITQNGVTANTTKLLVSP